MLADRITFSKSFQCNNFGICCNTLCCMISFINTNESICNFKHVVSQRDDDELRIFRLFLKEIFFVNIYDNTSEGHKPYRIHSTQILKWGGVTPLLPALFTLYITPPPLLQQLKCTEL